MKTKDEIVNGIISRFSSEIQHVYDSGFRAGYIDARDSADPCQVSFLTPGDHDHIWVEGRQYVVLKRVQEMCKEWEQKGRDEQLEKDRDTVSALSQMVYEYNERMKVLLGQTCK